MDYQHFSALALHRQFITSLQAFGFQTLLSIC